MSTQTGSEPTVGGRLAAIRHTRISWLDLGERFGLVVLLVAVIAFFSFWGKTSETFATSGNFNIIVSNQSVLAIAALAAIVPLVCGHFDLSVGSVVGLSSVVVAKLLADTGMPLWVCGIGGIVLGAAIGLVNGTLVSYLGVNSFITTLGTSTCIAGIGVWLTDGQAIVAGVPDNLVEFGSDKTLGLPNTLYVLVAAAILVWYVLEQTPFGRYLHAVGSNPSAARLVGLSVDRLVLRSFVISGAIAGAAGILQLARSGSGDPQIGLNFTLPALAAAFLGATAIKPGQFNVVGTVVAVFFLGVSVTGLTLAGSQPYVEDLFNGAALIVGVGVSTVIARQRLRAPRGAKHQENRGGPEGQETPL